MSKKRAIFTIVTGSIAVVFLSCVLMLGLRDDGFDFMRSSVHDSSKFLSASAHDVEIDPAEEPIDELVIDWEAGPIQVLVTKGTMIRISETSSRELSDDEHMRVMAGSGKLEINWDHNRFRFLGFPFFSQYEKSLVVELPESVAKALTEVECSNISGEMEVNDIACKEANFSSVSGAIVLNHIQCEEDCHVSTTSGAVRAEDFAADTLSVSTTSGSLNFDSITLSEADFDTVSGTTSFHGKAERFDVSTISGTSQAEFTGCPQELDMDSVSGEIFVALPKTSCFRVNHSTVSGDFSCDFFGKSGVYGSGTSPADFNFSTTSGDVTIAEN